MTLRPAAALGLAITLLPALLPAQTTGTVPGAATPGPAAPRPQTPPRDGGATVLPTGTGRIRGRVVAADTSIPLRRALVRVFGAQPGLQQTAITDADGRYEFLNVPASRYTLSVTASGYVGLQFGQQQPGDPGKPVNLVEGEVAEKIDFALPRGGVITGRIVDDLGQPVAGVRVQAQRYAYQAGGRRQLVGSGPVPPPPQTDDLGQFRLYGLIPGAYVVTAEPQLLPVYSAGGPATTISAGSGANASDGYAPTYFPGTANIDEAQLVAIRVGQETSVSFALVSARMSRISGVIRTSQGNPAGNVTVALTRRSGAGQSVASVMTQADGSFTLARVPPGEHTIEVRRIRSGVPGTATSDEFASVPISTTGQDISGLVITTGTGATISGRLVFEGKPPQAPPQPVRIVITSADLSAPIAGITTPNSGLVDETGRFQISGVSGWLLFRHNLQGWSLKSVTLDGVDIIDTPFEAKPSTNTSGLEITLTDRQTTVTGSVKNALGEPIKNFVIAVLPAGFKEGAAAMRFTRAIGPDEDGRYQLKGLPPGDYVAVAVQNYEIGSEWNPAFQQQMKPRGKTFHLSEGQSLALDLTLVQ